MLKPKTVVCTMIAVMGLAIVSPVFAVSHKGGEWHYGGDHVFNDWGAYSNYRHNEKYHFVSVSCRTRNNQQTSYAGAKYSAVARINTNIGEVVDFDAGW